MRLAPRHVVPLAAGVLLVAAALAATMALGALHRGPGVVWMLSPAPQPALRTALVAPGTRLVALKAGGRLAVLRADALSDVRSPDGAWLLRTPLPAFALAGCG